MKKNVNLIPPCALLLLACSVLFSACDESDSEKKDVDCEAAMKQLNSKYGLLLEFSSNCDQMQKLADEISDLFDDVKDCDELKEAAAAAGYDNVQDYINAQKETLENYLSDC